MTWRHVQQKIQHLHAEADAIKPLIWRFQLFRKFSSETIANNSSAHGRTDAEVLYGPALEQLFPFYFSRRIMSCGPKLRVHETNTRNNYEIEE